MFCKFNLICKCNFEISQFSTHSDHLGCFSLSNKNMFLYYNQSWNKYVGNTLF